MVNLGLSIESKWVAYYIKKVKVIHAYWCGADLGFTVPQPDTRLKLMLQDHRHGADVSHSVTVYLPAFAGTIWCSGPL